MALLGSSCASVRARGALVGLAVVALASACASKTASRSSPAVPGADTPAAAADPIAPEDLASVLQQADAALAAEQPARAVALFGRYLAAASASDHDGSAYLGLAAAHEQLRDCAAAIVAYEAYLQAYADGKERITALVRRGACEAELEQWDASAASFAQVEAAPDQLPSTRIEALARQGYALFMLDRFDDADALLARADEIYERAMADGSERFASYYFVGMARFYRAAILHHRFRDVEIRMPEDAMAKSFKQKLELLERAQDAYNHTIKARHMFWVSAAGFQLGHLFGEFYDAIMYAPVPEWLDDRQRTIYYEELKKQLRPVIDKAVWVFEKNLETARRLGYESEFTDATEHKLGQLQAVLLSDDATLGRPHERLTPPPPQELSPPPQADEPADRPAAERKLFVPRPTPL